MTGVEVVKGASEGDDGVQRREAGRGAGFRRWRRCACSVRLALALAVSLCSSVRPFPAVDLSVLRDAHARDVPQLLDDDVDVLERAVVRGEEG